MLPYHFYWTLYYLVNTIRKEKVSGSKDKITNNIPIYLENTKKLIKKNKPKPKSNKNPPYSLLEVIN